MSVERGRRVWVAIACFGALALPLVFLFARPGTIPGSGALFNLYSPVVTLLGEKVGRFVFCALWLGLDAGLVWRFFLSKRKDLDTSPIEGLGD
jgi:hypothetical protein